MHPLLPVTLLLSCVSGLVLPPLITPEPRIVKREAAENICGYYSLAPDGLIETLSCSIGTPCLVATNLAPAVGYCSGTDNAPITTIYPYGDWPSVEGCGPGAACCPASMPDAAKFLFNEGATVFLGCGLVSGTFSASAPTAVHTPAAAATKKSSSMAGPTTNSFLSGITTPPVSDTTSTPVTPLPSQTPTSSSFSSTTTITIIIVGAVVALFSGIVFLWFLSRVWKVHQEHKYPQQPYTPLSMQDSTTSFYSGAPVKKSGLSKWAKIATVISPIFAIVGLVVAIYFGLKQQK